MSGSLYVVATPIGNLEDLTLRALRILKEVDAVVCEDTRVTSRLLSHYEFKKPLVALHEHSSADAIDRLVRDISNGKSVAYVSDAGTPGVNDPGGKLVQAAFEAGVHVVAIPGVSALTAAISVCGFAMDDFVYAGFVPHKKGRQTFWKEVSAREIPTILFESTHRIEKALDEMAAVLDPSRKIFIGRELTKMHETLYRGTIDEVKKSIQATSSKGEFVVIIGPA
ncbi:16S rRNA (cytidine(1402)-2'-O)-methyltransferase [Candidatus Uhrbacteria bacterium]|nr:16S rRNA (cytidine(1402)-2'-O)-methyltransferase [Candidatus Uhrbacteria bacterium]